MAGLFSRAQSEKIIAAAQKSKVELERPKAGNPKKVAQEVEDCEATVIQYFKDSQAILIESKEQLHDYITKCIEAGYAGIDTETTGLDRVKDTIVGASLYYPGGIECYIPSKHKIPIFDIPYQNQLTYEEIGEEFSRLVDAKTRLIFANADYDLAMIKKDLKVDFNDNFYFDVILAWRCLKEDEMHNDLKSLYNKYVLKGEGEPMKFRDFFSPTLFPYAKPQVAKLYAANDAKITYDLFRWQLPFVSEDTLKCQKRHLEQIAALLWNVELPLVKVCQNMHRDGIFLDKDVADVLHDRYHNKLKEAQDELARLVDEAIENCDYVKASKRTFKTGKDFNPNSPIHCKYLFNTMLGLNVESTGKDAIAEVNIPITNQILKIRSLNVLINTFVDKLPKATTSDSRIHAQFKQIGAGCITGDSIIPTPDGAHTIAELCDSVLEDTNSEYIPLQISVYDKYLNIVQTSNCVKFVDVPTIRIYLSTGHTIEGTPNHPVMVYGNQDEFEEYTKLNPLSDSDTDLYYSKHQAYFKKLEDIQIKDSVVVVKDIDLNITSVGYVTKIKHTRNTVYDFTVPETHSFISNGMISHNTGRMCIAEHVPVTCLNGVKPIKDIKPGDLVYCYDDEGNIHLSPVKHVWKTGTNRDCVTIKWQSSGKGDIGYLTCTPEHRVRLKSGDWARADTLKRYDKLAHLRRTCGRRPDRRPDLYGWNGLATREQDVIKTDVFHANTSMSIHHRDNNPQNNELTNLQILTASEHAKITIRHQMVSGKHATSGLHTAATNAKRTAIQRQHTKAMRLANKQFYLDCIASSKGRITLINDDSQTFKDGGIDAGIDIVHECARYNTYYAEKAFPIDTFNEAWNSCQGDVAQIAKFLDTSVETVTWLSKQYDACSNHMVQSVEYAGKFDVYDIEVEGYHNFIAGEINVHNSSAEPNMQNIPSGAQDIRHLFRATPTTDYTLEVESNDNILEFTIQELQNLNVEGKEWTCGKDLQVGDIFYIENNQPVKIIELTRDDLYITVKGEL